MRIVVDLQSCQSGSSLGGIGRYSIELAKAIALEAASDDVYLILNNQNYSAVDVVRREFQGILSPAAIRVFDIPAGCSYMQRQWRTIAAAEAIREAFLDNLAPDVVHQASLFEGLDDDVVTSIPLKGFGPPTAVTLYDLIPYRHPEVYLKESFTRAHYFAKLGQLKNAAAVLAISQYSANDAREYLGSKPLIANISGGVDEKFIKLPEGSRAGTTRRLQQHGVGERFLLYTASFDHRKNHERLIQAFGAVSAAARRGCQLVIVGNGWTGMYSHLNRVAVRSGLAKSDIVFTGRISDDDLIALYNRCLVFVFPPLWEGLGLPPLEAMACGAAAIGSNTTSVPEVIGRSDALFDPTGVKDIARVIERTLTDEAFLSSLRAHAAIHHKRFSWRLSARIALTTMREMHARASTSARYNHGWEIVARRIKEFGAASEAQLRTYAYCLASNEIEAGGENAEVSQSSIGMVAPFGGPQAAGLSACNWEKGFAITDLDLLSANDPARFARLNEQIEARSITDVIFEIPREHDELAVFCEFADEQIRKRRRLYIWLGESAPGSVLNTEYSAMLEGLCARAIAVFTSSGEVAREFEAKGIRAYLVEASSIKRDGGQSVANYVRHLVSRHGAADVWELWTSPGVKVNWPMEACLGTGRTACETIWRSDGLRDSAGLPPGLFRLVIEGHVTNASSNAGVIELTCDSGRTLLARKPFERSPACRADIIFHLSATSADLVVTVLLETGARIEVTACRQLRRRNR